MHLHPHASFAAAFVIRVWADSSVWFVTANASLDVKAPCATFFVGLHD